MTGALHKLLVQRCAPRAAPGTRPSVRNRLGGTETRQRLLDSATLLTRPAPDRHAATATTLFAAATLGSFYYTLAHGRSAWLDAETLLAGRAADDAGAAPRQHAPTFVMRLK